MEHPDEIHARVKNGNFGKHLTEARDVWRVKIRGLETSLLMPQKSRHLDDGPFYLYKETLQSPKIMETVGRNRKLKPTYQLGLRDLCILSLHLRWRVVREDAYLRRPVLSATAWESIEYHPFLTSKEGT